jgi:O-antigen ligase
VTRPTLTAGRPTAGALVLALAVPPLFLHARYSPGFSVSGGSTSLSVELADLAVLAVAIAALAAARRHGLEPLRGSRAVWIAGAAYLGLVLAGTLYGPAVTDGYPLGSSLVSAAKYAEYGVLALALPLLVRRAVDLAAVFLALVAWSAAATGWGLLQFLGLVDEFEGRRPGQRETSFLGVHDFAALSAAALALALVAVAFGAGGRRERQLAWIACVGGTLGVVLSGALASVGAVLLGALVVGVAAWRRSALTRRRALALAAIAVVVLAGSLAIRSADLDQLLRFVGVSPEQEETTENVQSYAHRTVLAYIGVRIFLDHPVLGVGWQGSALESSYEPYLDDARRRYPSVSAESLPSAEHPWGVQNAYIQAAADLGVPGLLAFVALFAAGVWTALAGYGRGPPQALVALLWLVVAAAELTALGLFAGVPIDALLWLALGLAVASRSVSRNGA